MKTGCLICFEVKRLYGQLLPKLIVCIFSYSNVHLYRTNPMQNMWVVYTFVTQALSYCSNRQMIKHSLQACSHKKANYCS